MHPPCDPLKIEENLFIKGQLPKRTFIKQILWDSVIQSKRWTKWLQKGESENDFYSISHERQEWLIKTGCRYIWNNNEIVAARAKLADNLKSKGIDAEFIVSSAIEHSMDKYFEKFNLQDMNELL